MGKLSFTLTSLIAAVPAAGLCYLLVMAFLGNFERMGTTLQAVAGLSLLGAALIALMPLGILIFFRGPDTPAKSAGSAADDVETFDDDAGFEDDAEGDSMGEIDAIADELDDSEFEDDDFESGELSVDDLDEADFDDDGLSGDIETSATLADDDDILDQDDMFVEGDSAEFGEFNDELLDDDDEFTLAEDDDDDRK